MNTQNQLNRVDNKQESVSAPSPGQISGLGCSTRNENSNNDVATLGSLNLQGAGGFSVTGQWGTNFQPLKNGDGTTMSSVERASRGRNDVQPPIPQPIMPSKHTLSLRKWIQHTSHTIGEKISTLYMECCLKIAILLTEQILQAEKLASYGIQDNLALLPIRNYVDWAKYTRVTLGQTSATYEQLAQKSEFEDTVSDIAANLETNIDVPNLTDQSCATDVRYKSDQESDSNRPGKKDASQDSVCNTPIAFDWESGAMIGLNEHDANASDEKSLQNLQLDSCEASISNSTEEEGDQRLNKQLDAFVERLCEDDVEVGEVSEETYKDQWGSASNNFVDRGETNQCLKFPDSNTIPTNYYLNIDSVQIECPESSFRKYADNVENTLREKRQRIFYLALLFYELFSEGIVPDSNMCAIAISDGAFVSLPTLTLAEEIESNDNTFSEPKRCRGPAGSGRNISLCKLCFERLKFMGIPGPICHLIFNMLDSVYGDLSGEESYNEMSDVKFDLQLMLRKPKFLRGLDMNELSSSSFLQFYSNSVLREEELQVIKSCYQRCQSGSSEIAIIKGESGSGKTWLAHRVGSFIVVGGGLFLMGKFDQLQQRRPFSALASAFDQYCDILVSQKESFWAETVVRMLNSTFGQDISYLINLIPKLGEIVKCNASSLAFSSDNDKDSDFGNNMERIKYLLCQFVEIINANSVASSITLFLDDLQWADEASIAVINRLVLSQARKKFFFLGCYRDDEMDNDHPFWKSIEGVRAYGINTIISHTKRLTEDALNDVISDMLSLSPRIVRSLSRLVFSKTKGNFLFISQLLLSLSRDGLLRIDLGRQRWIWDHSKIYSTKLPDNVAVCFTNGIKKLPMEVQLALHTLSMFGASAKLDCIAVLESDLNVTIIEPLQKAAAEGLVNEIGGFFQFCHDKIQEACYELIQDHDRCCNHLTYGRCIIKRALVVGDDEMLFTALNQINIGGPSAVTDKSEYYIMATHNLTAARKATEMSDFHTAYSFCDNGITFLRKTHWRDHYEFSLQLFDLASSCALAVGNHQDLRILSDHVLRNAHCFEHKLNIYFFMISSQALTSKTSDALNEGLGILSQLGENIPSIPSQLMVDQQMQQTLAIIGGVSEDNLLNYRVMFDTQKLAAMRFLAKLQNIAFFVNQILHSYIVLRMVQITVSYGLSPQSPVAIALFGSMLVRQGTIKMGGRFTMIAKDLSEKFGSKECASEVYFLVSSAQCFLQPLSAAIEYHVQGERAGLLAGDIHSACLNRLQYVTILFWLGQNLSVVKENISDACSFMNDQGHKNCLPMMLLVQSTVMMLLDSNIETQRRNKLLESFQEENAPFVQMLVHFHNAYLSLLLHQGDLKDSCEKMIGIEHKSGVLLYTASIHKFVLGLGAFRLYRKKMGTIWAERGRECIEEIKVWCEQGCTWNFEQKLKMLEAEENYSLGNIEGAKISYQDAISAARLHKFLNDEALACELAANFYFKIGDASSSLKYYRIAHEVYIKCGAIGKADDLFTFINAKFTSLLHLHGP